MSNRCVFCKKQDTLTKEHVLPGWLSRLYSNELIVTNEFSGTNIKWQSGIFQHTAKVVCENCNNGWMSELEAKAKPIIIKMLTLEKTTLDEESQNTIAFWAQKTALMINQSIPGGIKITEDAFEDIFKLNNFTKKILVSVGWRMMTSGNKENPLMSFELKQVPNIEVNKELFDFVTKEKENGGFIWKIVFSIGVIVFELIGHNMPVVLNAPPRGTIFKVIRPFDSAFIWPLEWPIEAEGGLDAIKART